MSVMLREHPICRVTAFRHRCRQLNSTRCHLCVTLLVTFFQTMSLFATFDVPIFVIFQLLLFCGPFSDPTNSASADYVTLMEVKLYLSSGLLLYIGMFLSCIELIGRIANSHFRGFCWKWLYRTLKNHHVSQYFILFEFCRHRGVLLFFCFHSFSH